MVRRPAAGIHQTVIKPGPTLFTITDAMYNEPLSFDVVPGKTADTRIFRLHGPITLANLFDFQKVLNAGTEAVTIIDFTDFSVIRVGHCFDRLKTAFAARFGVALKN